MDTAAQGSHRSLSALEAE
jgi:hypothetical protein